jgi:hypothetical protein
MTAGEGQQQFTQPQTESAANYHTDIVVRQENMVMGPMGPETKNYCTDEGLQQIM